jgi:hypothetical protein|tara:strand:- start:77 stop:316 length:240 start_codon:yes stop_codon:yes gene_type:complete
MIPLSKYINIKLFLWSLFLGIFFAYITGPQQQIILVYPTPENKDKLSYKDKSDNCYRYEAMEVQCPKDKKKISKYEIQR